MNRRNPPAAADLSEPLDADEIDWLDRFLLERIDEVEWHEGMAGCKAHADGESYADADRWCNNGLQTQSTCSQQVRFVLNAKELRFDEVKLNLLAGDQLKADYLKLNPNGVLPTLDHDGQIIIDSTVITEYLDDVEPANSFTPESPVARAHMRALMHFIDEMPTAAVRVPRSYQRFQKMSHEDFVAMAESKPLRREFMLTMGQTGFSKAEMDGALARLRRAYQRMDSEIEASGGPWLLGAKITLADVAVMPALVRMHDLGIANWQDLPRAVS